MWHLDDVRTLLVAGAISFGIAALTWRWQDQASVPHPQEYPRPIQFQQSGPLFPDDAEFDLVPTSLSVSTWTAWYGAMPPEEMAAVFRRWRSVSPLGNGLLLFSRLRRLRLFCRAIKGTGNASMLVVVGMVRALPITVPSTARFAFHFN